jgi:hypothetical protein
LTQLPVFIDPAATLEDFLCVGLIVPEVGCGRQRLYLRKFGLETGNVKDNSADRRRVLRGPGNA